MKNDADRPILSEPEVHTYENLELTIDMIFTGEPSGGNPPSSRRLKTGLLSVNARRVLRRLLAR